MAHSRGSERRDQRAAFVRRDGGEPLTQPTVTGVDAQLPPRLRVDEPQLADIGKLLLARVTHFDGEHGVAAGEAKERWPPVDRAAEVRQRQGHAAW